MSVSTKDKLEFVYAMSKHSEATLAQCKRLMRYASTLQRLAEKQCNEPWAEADEEKRARIEALVSQLCGTFGASAKFQNDPRGAVVKIVVPDSHTSDFGNEGICVPS